MKSARRLKSAIGMLPVVGQFLSEEDGWKVLLYERSLGEAK